MTRAQTLMPYMARAAREARSPTIRANTVGCGGESRGRQGFLSSYPIKQVHEGYDGYITPTMREVDVWREAGPTSLPLTAQTGKRGDGLSPWELHWDHQRKISGSDSDGRYSDYQGGIQAWKSGIDLVSTHHERIYGLHPQAGRTDFELVRAVSEELPIPVIGEGRVHTPEEAVKNAGYGSMGSHCGRGHHPAAGDCRALREGGQRQNGITA